MKIANEVGYNYAITKIDFLMRKGSSNVSKEELEEIRLTATAMQAYEKIIYEIDFKVLSP